MVGNVFDKLYEQGYFYDPVEKEVEEDFMPWLSAETSACINREASARACIDLLIADALKNNLAARVSVHATFPCPSCDLFSSFKSSSSSDLCPSLYPNQKGFVKNEFQSLDHALHTDPCMASHLGTKPRQSPTNRSLKGATPTTY